MQNSSYPNIASCEKLTVKINVNSVTKGDIVNALETYMYENYLIIIISVYNSSESLIICNLPGPLLAERFLDDIEKIDL